MLEQIVSSSLQSSSKIASEIVPSLEKIITVDNTMGRVDPPLFKAFTQFKDVFEDGVGSKEDLSRIELRNDEVINIQFTSGLWVYCV